MRLIDGACICDTLVQAAPESVVAAFGEPLKLAHNGRTLVDDAVAASIVCYAASFEGIAWSVVEAVNSSQDPDDYIVTMLQQARAALAGQVLPLPLSYENGLGVAQQVARKLGVPAVVVWGSDEWVGLGGGALFDNTGAIVRACNEVGPDEITNHLAARERMIAGEDDDDDDEADGSDVLFMYEPGRHLRSQPGDAISELDKWFKEIGAAQPQSPPSLWGVWQDYADVWGAVAR